MIINYDQYYCNACKKAMCFDTSKPYSKICPKCNKELEYIGNFDGDTERAARVAQQPKYDPTQDPKSPLYIPRVTCPYCKSTNTSKITAFDKAVNIGLFGIFGSKRHKQWHCNTCKSDF